MNIEDLLTIENLQPIINLRNEIFKAKLELYTELAQAEIKIYQARIDYESRKLTTTKT